MYRALPVGNKLLDERVKQRNRKHHKEKLKSILPSIDNAAPFRPSHLGTNGKRWQTKKDRNREIAKHNDLLLEHLVAINEHHQLDNRPPARRASKTLNGPNRRSELARIKRENEAIARRLAAQRARYNTRKWEDEFRQKQKILRNICEFPCQLAKTPRSARSPRKGGGSRGRRRRVKAKPKAPPQEQVVHSPTKAQRTKSKRIDWLREEATVSGVPVWLCIAETWPKAGGHTFDIHALNLLSQVEHIYHIPYRQVKACFSAQPMLLARKNRERLANEIIPYLLFVQTGMGVDNGMELRADLLPVAHVGLGNPYLGKLKALNPIAASSPQIHPGNVPPPELPHGFGVDVVVSQAKELVKLDADSESDAYVLVHVGDHTCTTKVVSDQANPVFSEHFKFVLHSCPEVLRLEVRDHDENGPDELIGTSVVHLGDLWEPVLASDDYEESREGSLWVVLALPSAPNESRGQVEVSVAVHRAYTKQQEEQRQGML